MDQLAVERGVRRYKDLYGITELGPQPEQLGKGALPPLVLVPVVIKSPLTFLITNGLGVASIAGVLMSAYPEHKWRPWAFSRPPTDLWGDPATVAHFAGRVPLLSRLIHWTDTPFSRLVCGDEIRNPRAMASTISRGFCSSWCQATMDQVTRGTLGDTRLALTCIKLRFLDWSLEET